MMTPTRKSARRRLLAGALVAAAVPGFAFLAAPAAAQTPGTPRELPPLPSDRLPIDPRDLTGRDRPSTAVAAGCIISQTYNTQSVDDYSVQLRIDTSSGPEMFNLTATHIVRVPGATGFTLARRTDTLKWTRFLDTFERAAMTDRPVSVSYETANNRVFGVTIDWNRKCGR